MSLQLEYLYSTHKYLFNSVGKYYWLVFDLNKYEYNIIQAKN